MHKLLNIHHNKKIRNESFVLKVDLYFTQCATSL